MNHSVSSKTKTSRSAVSAEAILDHLITATMVLDEELEVVFVNSQLESYCTASAAQIVGTPLNHILLSAQALQTQSAQSLARVSTFHR